MFVVIEYQKKYLQPVFGETKLMVEYTMTHKKNNCVNRYNVTCEIQGIKNCDLELVPQFAESLENETNQETLNENATMDLFLESI